jgi:hypothetical protein
MLQQSCHQNLEPQQLIHATTDGSNWDSSSAILSSRSCGYLAMLILLLMVQIFASTLCYCTNIYQNEDLKLRQGWWKVTRLVWLYKN